MRRRKMDYRKDDGHESGGEVGKNLTRKMISAVPDDYGGKFQMRSREKGLFEIDFQERRKNRSLISTFRTNDPMSKKVVPVKNLVYGIRMTEKRRWGSEPGKVL